MNIKNKWGRKYLSNTKRNLKCSIKLRHGFLKVLKNELHNFELDNPDADYSDYIAEFGTPQETTKSYLSELTRSQRAAYWLPLAFVLGAIIISAFIFLSMLLISQSSSNGFYELEFSLVSSSDMYVSYGDIESQ